MEQKSRVVINVRPFDFTAEDFSATTRAADSPATRLSFAVFDEDGEVVDNVLYQQSTDDNFGYVELELYPGTYKMVAVAHNGNSDAVVTSATSVTLPETTFTDTFAGVQDLTVEAGKDCNFSMTLPRIASAFILRVTDEVPSNLKEIELVVNSGGVEPTKLVIDPSTGKATNNWEQTRTISKAELESGDVPVYFIGMIKSSTITVKATAYDADGEVIISHTISSVPMEANRQTIATGKFFKAEGSGTFTLNTSWGTNNEIDY